MWTRRDLKWRARNTLWQNIFSQKWLMATVSVFITYTIFSLIAFFSIFISLMISFPSIIMAAASQDIVKIYLALIPSNIILLVLMAAIYIFLFGPLVVGMTRYFLANRDPYDPGAPSISLLFSVFRKGQYLKIVAAWAWMMLFLFLWLLIPIAAMILGGMLHIYNIFLWLLFFLIAIAGYVMFIIKSISYSMVPFILAENPQINYKRALKMSISMTNGQKGDIFVLSLSFIGWMLLGELALFIGIYWAYAYFYATYAELYDVLKKVAISQGICMPQEFGINPNGDPNDPYATPLDLNNPYIRNPYYSRRVYPQYQPYYNNYYQQNYNQPYQPPYNNVNTNYNQPYQQQGYPYQNNMGQNYNQTQYYNQAPTQNPQDYNQRNQQTPINNNPMQDSDSSQPLQQQQPNNSSDESQDNSNQNNNPQA